MNEVNQQSEEKTKEYQLLLEEANAEIKKYEEISQKHAYDGLRDISKYFDRINDKLFMFNNILIAGFFATGKLKDNVSVELIIFPIANLLVLIYMEFLFLEKSRMASYPAIEMDVEKYAQQIKKTNKFSRITLITTGVVTIIFLIIVFI